MINIFKPHLVRFNNGKYAVKKYSILYLEYIYKDFNNKQHWWDKDSTYFDDCLTDNIEEAKLYLDKGEPV